METVPGSAGLDWEGEVVSVPFFPGKTLGRRRALSPIAPSVWRTAGLARSHREKPQRAPAAEPFCWTAGWSLPPPVCCPSSCSGAFLFVPGTGPVVHASVRVFFVRSLRSVPVPASVRLVFTKILGNVLLFFYPLDPLSCAELHWHLF